jgi:hypothetical protein
MKRILVFLIIFPIFSFSQNRENGITATHELRFVLDIEIFDVESNLTVSGAEVTILDTDGSSMILISNDSGKCSINLNRELSYYITITHSDYLTAKGQETTVGLMKSTRLIHEFRLQPIKTFHEYFHKIDFDSTFSFNKMDFGIDTIVLYSWNNIEPLEKANYQLIKSLDKDEYQIFRPINSTFDTAIVEIELIDTSLIKIRYNHIATEYFVIGYSNNHKFWYELTKMH